MRACVVGLGKIGLPLAVQIASRGVPVVGADASARVVEQVSAGHPPFPGEHDLDARLAAVVDASALTATTDTALAVSQSDVVLVVVPLVVDAAGAADYSVMDAATADVARGLRPGTLVVYETTLPVGTTRSRLLPALAAGSGLRGEGKLLVAHSPERVLSGRVFADLRRYPKVVGGVDAASAARAIKFYERVLEFDPRPDLPRANGVWDVGSAEAAELVKLAETTYRDINIAFANELARFADRLALDLGSVIEAANSQPYSHVHRPGVAVGGHCIPVYPLFLLAGEPTAALPAAARRVNEQMPSYAVARLDEHLPGGLRGRTVVVLGAAYRGGVKELAFSGAFAVVDELVARGATPLVHDPLFSDAELLAHGLQPYAPGGSCDAAVLQADHAEYAGLTPAGLPGVQVVLDGRGVLDPDRWPGVTLVRLGGPPRRGSGVVPAP